MELSKGNQEEGEKKMHNSLLLRELRKIVLREKLV